MGVYFVPRRMGIPTKSMEARKTLTSKPNMLECAHLPTISMQTHDELLQELMDGIASKFHRKIVKSAFNIGYQAAIADMLETLSDMMSKSWGSSINPSN